MSNVRIKDLETDSALSAGDYIIVDSDAEGTRKYDIGSGLAGKVNKPAGNGTSGQVLKTNGDGTTQWANESGGGSSITVDSALSSSSENPVQNKVIDAAMGNKQDLMNKGTAGGTGTVIDYNSFKETGVWYVIASVNQEASNAPFSGSGYAMILTVETTGAGSSKRIKQTATRYGAANQATKIRTSENGGSSWQNWQTVQTTRDLVTSLSSYSTDTQYPSAKCVYDGLAGKQGATTIVNKSSSDTSQTLAENNFYIWPEMSALTITCPATGGPYAFRFTSGSTATTLTMTGITMPDSFTVEANKVYEINVYQGYGLAASWEVSS